MTNDLIIDLSPMLVNRTAMFDVCREVSLSLEGENPLHQYYGEIFYNPPSGFDSERLRTKLGSLIESASIGKFSVISAITANNICRRPGRILFLDPLYTLFSNIHEDDIVLILDMSTVTHPWWHNAAVSTLYEVAFERLSAMQPKLLAISENTADTFVANYGYTKRPIEIVPLYVPDHLDRATEQSSVFFKGNGYFLFVGSLEARKNVVGAISAFAQSGLADQGYLLFIIGGDALGADEIKRLARQTPGVILYGFVKDAELSALYAGACGFVYPSYLEGFGVPLLEAMRYGVPAIASITGACPEVGGDIVSYCDPDDHGEIARAMLKIADMPADERAALAIRAKRRVTDHFSLKSFRQNITQAALTP